VAALAVLARPPTTNDLDWSAAALAAMGETAIGDDRGQLHWHVREPVMVARQLGGEPAKGGDHMAAGLRVKRHASPRPFE
jgi:hypothetical protein